MFIDFAAAISFALAAEPLKIPRWMYNANRYLPANIPNHNLASQSTCDIQNLKSCMLTFFGSIGMSNTTLPTEEDLDKFYEVADPTTAQAIKDLCSYMNNLTQCAPSTDCWTQDSMNQLGFPNGTEEADNVLGTLLPYQYMCTNYYQTAVNNWECIVRTEDDNDTCTASNNCTDIQGNAICLRNVKSKECNNDVGMMICNIVKLKAMWRGGGRNGAKRSQRERDEEEEQAGLLVFGYACKLFDNDEKGQWIAEERHLIPWNDDESLKIDR
uniref:Suppressor of white apricot N-terminal domain-containing protein n=1 Tax=Plectus sambesii TaxID=2011161 RepID=A0A914XJA5_9BILA